MCLQIINLIYVYKEDLALNNLQWLICYKIKPNTFMEFGYSHVWQQKGLFVCKSLFILHFFILWLVNI